MMVKARVAFERMFAPRYVGILIDDGRGRQQSEAVVYAELPVAEATLFSLARESQPSWYLCGEFRIVSIDPVNPEPLHGEPASTG